MTDIEELEDQIVDLRRQIDSFVHKEESIEQWKRNLKKEEKRLKEMAQDFERRVQQTVDIRTIGLQHELRKAQYITSLYVKQQRQEETVKNQLHKLFATIFFRLKKFV